MVRIVVSNTAYAADSDIRNWQGLTMTGRVGGRPVITGSTRPLQLWEHVLQPGGTVEWERSDASHLVYVCDGAAEAKGEHLVGDGSLIVGRGASATLRAGDAPLTLLHFCSSSKPGSPTRAGGCVHVLNRRDAPYYSYDSPETQRKFTDGVVFADSGCPSCGLWLHESRLPGNVSIGRHLHTEDEIIVVLDGCLNLGRQELRAGDAVAIDANTMYTFRTGPDGLRFINFRPSEPYVVMATPDGENTAPMSEKQWMADHIVPAL